MVKTDGYTGGEFSKRYELCVYWEVSVVYEKGARGQIAGKQLCDVASDFCRCKCKCPCLVPYSHVSLLPPLAQSV